ncbi:hypothetical protein Bhyg_00912 [Pseudolycoriella hygida]|uniref:Uncharacterized protein n=1 Tax=Pseudolycoriella hygida TaxID=35572 RepID=A0A9Q0N8S1_9DIPT|nr:hypothetical protein Bhyg_00912 [Pseudolycoriella hygida]
METISLKAVVLLLIALGYIDAGPGIAGGHLDYTMYLDDKSYCGRDRECIDVCKNEARNPDLIMRAECVKFVGNLRKYCCCYTENTNACCQNANSGLDCVPSKVVTLRNGRSRRSFPDIL